MNPHLLVMDSYDLNLRFIHHCTEFFAFLFGRACRAFEFEMLSVRETLYIHLALNIVCAVRVDRRACHSTVSIATKQKFLHYL
jgi:hypothetical protein